MDERCLKAWSEFYDSTTYSCSDDAFIRQACNQFITETCASPAVLGEFENDYSFIEKWKGRANRKAETPKPRKNDQLTDVLHSLIDNQPSEQYTLKDGFSWLYSECASISGDEPPAVLDVMSQILDALVSLEGSEGTEQQFSSSFDDVAAKLGFSYVPVLSELLQRKDCILDEYDSFAEQLECRPKTPDGKTTESMEQMLFVDKNAKRYIKQKQKRQSKLRDRPIVSKRVLELWHYGAVQSARDANATVELSQEERDLELFKRGVEMTGPVRMQNQMLLPSRAKVEERQRFTVIQIPAAEKNVKEYPAVPISELPAWAQPVFSDIKAFNRVQSLVFDAVFRSRENLVVSAPTGSGKTMVALLAVMQALNVYFEEFHTSPPAKLFKVVYIAPLKSLVAEIGRKFADKLACLGLKVAELTGDMPLTNQELQSVHVIITVPEKWDIITRNGCAASEVGDKTNLLATVRLTIIDEVHLVGESRGPVLEAIVARTFLFQEKAQCRQRLIGLSATLPNWEDVAEFLRCPPNNVFKVGDDYRPVPLEITYYGVKGKSSEVQNGILEAVYDSVRNAIAKNKQAMVFVHSRNDTLLTAQQLIEAAQRKNELRSLFVDPLHSKYGSTYSAYNRKLQKSTHAGTKQLFGQGFGIHHAGMLRPDRRFVEDAFMAGAIRVIVTTATLAWGVNLPAHTVVIKGTDVFSSEQGGFCDLGVLDILQIFGRAGRPQFDDTGHGVLVTTHQKLQHYVALLSQQVPLESQFAAAIENHLNAEIALGNVTDERSGAKWLMFTFAFIRMTKRHEKYGITAKEFYEDQTFEKFRRKLISSAAQTLKKVRLIRCAGGGQLYYSTALGRTAAKFCIHYRTVASLVTKFCDINTTRNMKDSHLLLLLGECEEFLNITVRNDEEDELLQINSQCRHRIGGGHLSDTAGKVAVLIQAHIDRIPVKTASLLSDCYYISQNLPRLLRGLLDMVLAQNINASVMFVRLLELTKAVESRIWPSNRDRNENIDARPLRHFCFPASDMWGGSKPSGRALGEHGKDMINMATVERLEEHSLESLFSMTKSELASLARSPGEAEKIAGCLDQLPYLEINASLKPITPSIVCVKVDVFPGFRWSKSRSGFSEPFRILLENPLTETILHSEELNINKASVDTIPKGLWRRHVNDFGKSDRLEIKRQKSNYSISVSFSVPLQDPRPPQYVLKIISQRWVDLQFQTEFALEQLLVPSRVTNYSDLLPLTPLPISALHNAAQEALYKFGFFNPVQTQIFHAVRHTDYNILLGAPTGSGKTVVAELAMYRIFEQSPDQKVIYIAPLKALAKERLNDWTKRLGALGKKVIEVTGDFSPDLDALTKADLLITTPEKWDGISRHWQHRMYVQRVGLVIIDEIHLLGNNRGPVLEVIVSRMRFISSALSKRIRFVGLSTALANAGDIADWLGIGKIGLFNFRPAVRPVPCKVFIKGFDEKHYCPRMATMNGPAFEQILANSLGKPVLVFVSSRRQTRRTAQHLIALIQQNNTDPDLAPAWFLKSDLDPHQFETQVLSNIKDENLKDCLRFGIGLHHAGLIERDRVTVEHLFEQGTIKLLVATSTLAWGVNLPARMVILKGTEFYDGRTRRYVDMPITDVLQMIGRAGRPQFDTEAFAVIFAHAPKKQFYRKFLYEPFPVESALSQFLTDHINAEISARTITCFDEAVDFLTWTYFFRRLNANPSFYHSSFIDGSEFVDLASKSSASANNKLKARREQIGKYVPQLLRQCIEELIGSGCLTLGQIKEEQSEHETKWPDKRDYLSRCEFESTELGRIASLYYVSHQTVFYMADKLCTRVLSFCDVMEMLCSVREVLALPVRHNEDVLNAELASSIPLGLMYFDASLAPGKAFILLQMQMFRFDSPVADYWIDLASLLANMMRLIQAASEIAWHYGKLQNILSVVAVLQHLTQGTHPLRSSLFTIPGVTNHAALTCLREHGIDFLPQFVHADRKVINSVVRSLRLSGDVKSRFMNCYCRLPKLKASLSCSYKVDGETRQVLPQYLGESDIVEYSLGGGPGTDFVLTIDMSVGYNDDPKIDRSLAWSPLFPKEKTAGYWCILGDSANDSVIDFKRVRMNLSRTSQRPYSHAQCSFKLHTPSGNEPSDRFTVYICSDSYVDLDQEFDVRLSYPHYSEPTE